MMNFIEETMEKTVKKGFKAFKGRMVNILEIKTGKKAEKKEEEKAKRTAQEAYKQIILSCDNSEDINWTLDQVAQIFDVIYEYEQFSEIEKKRKSNFTKSNEELYGIVVAKMATARLKAKKKKEEKKTKIS
ncbi:MAG: hypothetical protein RR420_01275 [Anaerovoracaceae bacterium]